MTNQLKDTHIALTSVYEIAEACNPLVEILGIDFFCYHKIFPNGKEILLSNDIKWVHHVLTRNLVLAKDFVAGCARANKKTFAATLWSLDRNVKIVQDFVDICNGSYGITLTNNNNEYFGFCIKKISSPSVIDNYINNIKLLERFCLFFTEQMKESIEEARKDMVLYCPPKVRMLSSCREDFTARKISFVNKTPLKKLPLALHHVKEVSLTAKEMEYLGFFIQGLSD